jgi:hypothetical protein
MSNLPARRIYEDYITACQPSETSFLGSPLNTIAGKDPDLAASLIAGLATTKFRIVEKQEDTALPIVREQQASAVAIAREQGHTTRTVARINAELEETRARAQVEISKVNALRDTFVSMSAEVGATVRATGRPFQMKTAVKKPGFFGMKTEKEIVVRGEFLD